MNIKKRLYNKYSSKALSGSLAYIRLHVIVIVSLGIITGVCLTSLATGYPRFLHLCIGLIGWAIVVIMINGECFIAVKLMIKPIDNEIRFLIYKDTSDIEYRCKAVTNLLYMRQHRVMTLRGTIFNDKTYPYIKDFKSYLNEPYYMLKRNHILPEEFWVQKY